MSEIVLDTLARQIAATYFAERCMLVRPWGEQETENFYKAAKICMENKYDPCKYVKAQFRPYNTDFKFSTLLVQGAYAFYYKQYIDLCDRDPDKYYRAQMNELTQIQTRTGLTMVEILLEDLHSFSAWFRIIITPFPNKAIIAKYKEEAKKELSGSTVMNTFIKSVGGDLDRIYGR